MAKGSIVILTGAGISAESGISTFRDSDGLWCNHAIEDVATPEGFERNPHLVHQFYNARRRQLTEVHPNAAHEALVHLAQEWDGELLLVTQNVDDLHGRAAEGKDVKADFRLIHMHGELNKARCVETDNIFDWRTDLTRSDACLCCGETDNLRPHIVWFGEMPLEMDRIEKALQRCNLFLSIGTSGNVYPAAGFVQLARQNARAHTVEINLEPAQNHSLFHEHIYGKAGTEVPRYVTRILAGEI